MKSYCLKCKTDTKNKIQEFQILLMVKQCYDQNVQNVVVKNQYLLKIKRQNDY